MSYDITHLPLTIQQPGTDTPPHATSNNDNFHPTPKADLSPTSQAGTLQNYFYLFTASFETSATYSDHIEVKDSWFNGTFSRSLNYIRSNSSYL